MKEEVAGVLHGWISLGGRGCRNVISALSFANPHCPNDAQLVTSSSPILPHGVVLTAAPGAQLP